MSNKRIILITLLFVALSFISNQSYATHAVAVDVEYKCLGGNQYEITLNLYRDCDGAVAPTSASVTISSASCGISNSLTLNGGNGVEVSQVCASQLPNTTCNGGSLPGIERYTYTGIYTFPTTCVDWTIGYSLCCRNNAITNLVGSPNIYAEATLNNTNGICNNSPTFANMPIPYVCTNQLVGYNHGASDIDGNTLTYSLIQPQSAANTNIAYTSGSFSPTNPLNTTSGLTFSSTSGQIGFTPSSVQQAVITVLITETNAAGVVVGTTMRDMQVVVLNCNNDAPSATGIDGTANFVFDVCWGNSFCFDVLTNDINLGDNVSISWDNGIAGGTFTTGGNPYPTGTFCWSPIQADIGPHFFSVTVEDDACPIVGTNTFTYQVNVINSNDPPVNAGSDQSICGGASAQLNATAGPGAIFTWSPATGLSCTNCPNPVATPSSNISYVVSAAYPSGCTRTDNMTITFLPGPVANIFPVDPEICSGSSIALTVSTAAGNGILWQDGAITTSTTASPATSGYFSVAVTGPNGCITLDSTYISVSPPPPTAICNNIYVTPNGVGDGSSQTTPTDLLTAILNSQCANATIKMAQGTYNIDNAIVDIIGAVTIEGGYDAAAGWVKSSTAGATRIVRSNINLDGPGNIPRLSAFEISNASYFRLQDLTIEVVNAAAPDSFGVSTYALHLSNCSNYDIVRCQMIAGDASNGINGVNGANGINGGNGLNGGAGDCQAGLCPFGWSGGAGGAAGNGGNGVLPGVTGTGRNGGGGGAGGQGSEECNDDAANGGNGGGSASQAISSGGTAGNGGNPGTDGTNGGNGTNGINGVNGILIGTSAHGLSGFWEPGKGESGTDGTGGSGGAGGGGGGRQFGGIFVDNGTGNGGAGGGGGGQGGQGGQGGYGGGASFGVYVYNNGASGNIEDCFATNGNFGVGSIAATGGTAGTGGTGGNGGVVCTADVGEGGDGGNGGDGGAGGNGTTATDGVSGASYVNGTGLTNADFNFNLIAQPEILVDNISCANTDINFSAAANALWDLDVVATNQTPTGANVLTQYTSLSRKNIQYGADTYTGFLNVSFSSSIIPAILTSLDSVAPDTFIVCAGDSGTFWPSIAGVNFDWNFGGAVAPNTYNTANISGIKFNTPGAYTVTLRVSTDCCGWTNRDTITIIVDDQPTITITGNTEICLGESTVLTATTSGTNIQWSPFLGLNINTGSVVTCNASDTIIYVVTAESSQGQCSADTTIQVNINELPDLTNTSTLGSTCGNDGSATVTPTGGTGAYSYAWSDPASQTTPTANNLYTGNYGVTVTDLGTGCSDSTYIFVPNTNSPAVFITNSNNPLCYNSLDGSAYANVTGGSGPYTYIWLDNFGTTINSGLSLDSLKNIGEGTYTVSITDANGCADDYTFTLSQPDSVWGYLTDSINAGCYGQFDGMLEVQGDGGVGSFTYLWDDINASTTQMIDSLNNGTYTVTVTDANGCQNTLTTSFPPVGGMPIVIDPGVDDTVCGATHILNATPSALNGHWILNSGPGNITFNPSTLDPNASVFISAYGIYEVLWVEDNGVCSDTGSVEILFIEQPIADAGPVSGSICGLDHNLAAVPSTGTGTWSVVAGVSTVVFNPNVNTPNVSVQFGTYGAYTLDWTEDNGFGCVSSDQINITTVNFNVNAGAGDTVCGNQFTFNAIPAGNNGHWTQESGPGTTTYNPSNTSATAITSVNLFGLYNYAWVEDNGVCSDTGRISVRYVEMPVAEAGLHPDTLCGLTTALNAIPSVGLGNWTLASGAGAAAITPSNMPNANVTVSNFGNYIFLWTEDNGHGCIDSEQIPFVAFNQVVPYIIVPDIIQGCLPSFEVNFRNFTDTTDLIGIFWDFDDGTFSQEYEPTHTFDNEGCYDISLISKTRLGCNLDTTFENLICVYPLPNPDFYTDPPSGTITDNIIQLYNQSTGAVSYSWEIEGADTLIYEFEPSHPFPNNPGIYSVCLTAITEYGCEATVCDNVEIKDIFSIYVPTAFTPNGNNRNDKFFPVLNGAIEDNYQFVVFDRWGDIIFDGDNLGDSWDGTVMQGGKEAPTGVYIWKVIVTDLEELFPSQVFTGHVTLIR